MSMVVGIILLTVVGVLEYFLEHRQISEERGVREKLVRSLLVSLMLSVSILLLLNLVFEIEISAVDLLLYAIPVTFIVALIPLIPIIGQKQSSCIFFSFYVLYNYFHEDGISLSVLSKGAILSGVVLILASLILIPIGYIVSTGGNNGDLPGNFVEEHFERENLAKANVFILPLSLVIGFISFYICWLYFPNIA